MSAPPLPAVDADSRPFWDAARAGRLVIQRCIECGLAQFYPRPRCVRCDGGVEWTEATGDGTVYSYTVVHRAPHESLGPLVPYVIALVDLSEGVRMMSRLRGVGADEARIGLPVRVAFERLTDEISLPVFEARR